MASDGSTGVRCMLMRGGTSKGSYFLRDDLPADPGERDELLLRVVGSPDPRQIDGIGGAHPLTTKVAVIGPSTVPGADVDYLFLQPSVDEPVITDAQNCGNILAGVGPFAVERGLVTPSGREATVRIAMLNTASIAEATFPLDPSGCPRYDGDLEISGVPGSAAPIRLDFEEVAGSTCGTLLPTGSVVDTIDGVQCTLIDCGMPVVVLRATDVGFVGDEPCAEIDAAAERRARIEQIRIEAGGRMGIAGASEATVPKVTMVAPPRDGGTLATRTLIPHRCHDAIGVLGGVSVAVAALIDGTPASEVAEISGESVVVLEHPTGRFDAVVELDGDPAVPTVDRVGILRTARKLMDGTVYPRGYA